MDDFNNQNQTQVDNSVVSEQTTSQTSVMPEIKPSSSYARWASNLLDAIYISLIGIVILFIFKFLTSGSLSINSIDINEFENNVYLQIIALIVILTCSVGFNVKKGATPGKSGYGLQIVKYGTMEKMGYGRAIARELLKLVSYIPLFGTIYFIINVIIILFSKQKRTIYDLIVGTQVIKIK
jgi:uncharacterized RDD family membrane protein YckC